MQEDKKAEVEARVEEASRKEREQIKRERQQLFLSKKQQIAQVKALEIKLMRSRQYQEWRSAQIPLLNFIKTQSHPPIYYLPKIMTPETESLLAESSKSLKGGFHEYFPFSHFHLSDPGKFPSSFSLHCFIL